MDGDGKISVGELMAVMSSVGKEFSLDDANEIMDVIDEDGVTICYF